MEEKTFRSIAWKSYKSNLWNKIWWPIYRFIMNFPDRLREVKFWFQRANKGYDQTYWYNLDHNIIKMILPNLKKLRDEGGGFPPQFTNIEEWQEVLDKIISGFEAALRVEEHDHLEIIHPHWFEDAFMPTAEEIRKEAKMVEEDMKSFKDIMPLFTEYFFNLWD